ncbi:MAG: 1,4-alpha-glucan branching protein GlgB [Actinomycetota bacterium]
MRAVTDEDRWLLAEGRHHRLYEVLGCHLGQAGTTCRLWAPNAAWVSVVGSFNGWNREANPMAPLGSGMWEAELGDLRRGDLYKYQVTFKTQRSVNKADPYAFSTETPPGTASRAWDLAYEWGDDAWMAERGSASDMVSPMAIYEVHLGSWRNYGQVSYREIAAPLAEYVLEHGFTHVELLPVMEHPFYGSWGYQVTAFFAPTSRYGNPQDLMYLIDHLHQHGIGVLLDWVPSHFPSDQHGLAYFDGTHLYEHPDPRRGYHPDWNSIIFDYDRPEVRSFLLSSAHFWLEHYHADGLRVDAVASMLYLDYSRKPGEWLPNRSGGRENLGAVEFLRQLTGTIRHRFPDAAIVAEESTSWPHVTGPPSSGGLGFHYKWDMGWMNDTLRYSRLDPLFRSHPDSHRLITFRGLYAGTESFLLPLSHDEVVYGKRSLLNKQWGDHDQRLAGLRALFGYMWATPGKKLLFMGGEFGQLREWNHDRDLDWDLLEEDGHRQLLAWVGTLNRLLRSERALHQRDHLADGFEWVEPDDYQRSSFAFLRMAQGARPILVVVNFTPITWERYQVGVPQPGAWLVIASSDEPQFGGTGLEASGPVETVNGAYQQYAQYLELNLPPLSAVFMAPREEADGAPTT